MSPCRGEGFPGQQPGPSKSMSSPTSQVVQKLWSYCNVLRDDGLCYGDYVEQLTFLLFRVLSVAVKNRLPLGSAGAGPAAFVKARQPVRRMVAASDRGGTSRRRCTVVGSEDPTMSLLSGPRR